MDQMLSEGSPNQLLRRGGKDESPLFSALPLLFGQRRWSTELVIVKRWQGKVPLEIGRAISLFVYSVC